MFGNSGNRPPREPKQINYSNRKIISQSELDARNRGRQSGGGQRIPRRAQAVGGGSMITVVILLVYLFLGRGGGDSGKIMGEVLNEAAGGGGGDILSEILGAAGGTSGGGEQYSGYSGQSITLQHPEGEVQNVAKQEKRPYTVMIYMNGTDLESKYGCATKNLQAMLASGFSSENINLLLLTGGTQSWHNNAISNKTSIYHIEEQGLKQLADLGSASIADPKVLSEYVDFSVENFPADKYGFVFWNHGGGTIYGYGSDQNYNGARMSVDDMQTGFKTLESKGKKLEFIGFDCCLMGTLEIAYLLEPYANYLIASEETEPGLGWDYSFLKELSDSPTATGEQIGTVIVDKYVDQYTYSGEQATLAVIDLSRIKNLSDKFESFMSSADAAVSQGGFNTISKARQGTKSFGYTGEDRSSFDIVDIKNLAMNLQNQFPNEAKALISAVEATVPHYKNSPNVEHAYGISTYIPYKAKQVAPRSVETYSQMGILPDFVDFLGNYTQKLTGARVQRAEITRSQPQMLDNSDVAIRLDPNTLDEINKITFVIWRQLEEGSDYFVKLGVDSDVQVGSDGVISKTFDGYWATLGGRTACFYEVERTNKYQKYSTPATLNGQDVSIIMMFDDDNPNGKIVGAIPPSPMGDAMAPKFMEPINPGDTLALKYFAQLFLSDDADASQYTEAEQWVSGEEFTVGEDFKMEVVPVDDELYLYGFWIEDTQGNSYYTDFIEIRY